ncbi:DUF3592 domain-containing protein [Cellvibrio sp. pealriver]|uniref:DUF3592 domain-containing protein n=1 Tax=Cellvibrio sp. pealriver TaxID=1622269 RepID=UPI00069D33CC|nr:DUF3592 domain-containing protein [Cellvibrio sp. pealriver]
MKESLKGRLFMLLFALPFAGVGVGFLLFGVIPNLYEWQQMKSWPQVEARLLDAGLHTSRGDDSDTYRAYARYTYRYQMQDYTSERVAIMGGSDNIGDFQSDLARQLELAQRMGQPVPAWVNPNNPGDAVLNRELRWSLLGFKMIFVLVFGGVGIGLMIFTLKAKVGATDHPDSNSKPWLAQQEWASPEVTCNSKSSLWVIWFFALIWNLISLPATLAVPDEWAGGNKLILIALIFPLAGIYLLYWAINSTLSWRRFGQLRLQLDPYPGSIGGQVGGTLNIPIAYNAQQRFPVNLQCVRRYVTGSGKSRTSHESIVWQSNGLAQSTPAPGGGTSLAICFNVPANLPVSEIYSDDYRFWRLELNADLPGVDLHRQFEIPVFATGEKSRATSPLSTDHPQLNDEREASIEAVANIEQIPGGVRMHYPMLHGAGNNLVGLVCGLFFGGAGVLMHFESDAPAIMVWAFTLVGGLISFICLKWLFTSLHVQLDHNGLISERYWLGMPIGRDQIPRADIQKLYIGVSSRGQSAKGYLEMCKIIALTHSGKKIPVAMNLKGRDTAQLALEAIGGLSGYKIQ